MHLLIRELRKPHLSHLSLDYRLAGESQILATEICAGKNEPDLPTEPRGNSSLGKQYVVDPLFEEDKRLIIFYSEEDWHHYRYLRSSRIALVSIPAFTIYH